MSRYTIISRHASMLLALAILSLVTLAPTAPENLRRHLWSSDDFGYTETNELAESLTHLFYYTGESVVAVDKTDGSTSWTSPQLESSAVFLTWAAPLFVDSTNRVAVASGLGTTATFYLLDADTGTTVAQTNLGVSDGVVNATPAYANGVYYVHSNPNFADPTSSSLIAMNETDLSVVWRADDGGNGSSQPIIDSGIVYDFAYEGPAFVGNHRVRAYDAATSAVLWTSTVTLAAQPLGLLSLYDGDLYFTTYDFADSDPLAPTGEFISLSAVDGSLNFQVAAASGNSAAEGFGFSVISYGAYSYGRITSRSTVDGSVIWSRDEGNWKGSAVVGDGLVYWAGHPAAGFAEGRRLLVADAATGEYVDSIHYPVIDGTPVINGDIVYIAGGGRIHAFTEAPEMIRIKEAYVGSATEDYIILENAGGATIELAGWEIQGNDGLTSLTGYTNIATLPAYSLTGNVRTGSTVIIGATPNSIAGLTPELAVAGFDLPDLTGVNTVKGVRLVNPAGDVIDSATFIDGSASATHPDYATDDTGETSADRALDGMIATSAMRRANNLDTNESAVDFIIDDFGTDVENWSLY